MTYSIVARDPTTGDLGCAVQSKFLAVGSGVPHARAEVGAVATQALSNLTYGPRGLALLEAGATAQQALDVLLASDPLPGRRQAGIVDATGRVAAHTGDGCTGWAGHVLGEGFACQGNMLVSSATVEAMASVMREVSDPFPERLVRALAAGQEAGGDARGQQSAALIVVRSGGGYGGGTDRLVDLRVDDNPAPIDELARLLDLHRLYFQRPAPSELLPLEADLLAEVAARVARIRGETIDPSDASAVWASLDRWAGRENLEERMIEPGAIDRTVLRILRERDTQG